MMNLFQSDIEENLETIKRLTRINGMLGAVHADAHRFLAECFEFTRLNRGEMLATVPDNGYRGFDESIFVSTHGRRAHFSVFQWFPREADTHKLAEYLMYDAPMLDTFQFWDLWDNSDLQQVEVAERLVFNSDATRLTWNFTIDWRPRDIDWFRGFEFNVRLEDMPVPGHTQGELLSLGKLVAETPKPELRLNCGY